MKKHRNHLLLIFIFVFSSTFLSCQVNNDNYESEYQLFISSFINYLNSHESMSIYEFRYYFNDIENEEQMRIARKFCHELYNSDTCEKFVEKIRYNYNQEIIDYFYSSIKKEFILFDTIVSIVRLTNCKDKSVFKLIIKEKTGNRKTFYFKLNTLPNSFNVIKHVSPKELSFYSQDQINNGIGNISIGNIYNAKNANIGFVAHD